MLQDYEKQYGKENIHVGPITHRFGKSTYQVDLAKPSEPERVHITVDADTDLPQEIQVEKRSADGNWNADAEISMSFGGPAVNMDTAKFPANAKRVEMDFSKMMQDGMKNFDPFKNHGK